MVEKEMYLCAEEKVKNVQEVANSGIRAGVLWATSLMKGKGIQSAVPEKEGKDGARWR